MRAAPPGDPRRRTVAAAEMVEMLALYGWALAPDLGGDAPVALLARAVARGLPFAAGADGPLYDPAEAICHIVAAGLAGAEPAWRERFVATGRAMVRANDPHAPSPTPLPPRDFHVGFTRRFDLRALAGRERARLRLPRPIEDDTLSGLVLNITAPGEVAESRGRIEIRLAGPPPLEMTIGWSARFDSRPAAPGPTSLTDADRATWLAPAEGLVRVTPQVRALAGRLAGIATDEHAIVAAFHDHLLGGFACGIVAYEAIDGPATDHVLRTGWYDCQLGAALLVALCRARALPARLVGGYLLWPAPAWHVWCEIWFDGEGWRPFDLLAWDLSAGGRDRAWRDIYAGRIDHRMKTQILPHLFAGSGAMPISLAHHRLARREGQGVAIDHRAIDGRSIYRDTIFVTPDPA